jgi:sporulation protein YlmC with PRC-barrel domain
MPLPPPPPGAAPRAITALMPPLFRRTAVASLAILLAAAAPPPSPTPAPPPAPPPAEAKKPPPPAPAAISKIAASGILGRKVLGPDGQEIGRVVDVLVDASGSSRAAVIDFGGFMGVGSRRIAVDWSDLSFPPAGSSADIRLDLTADQIKNAPAYTGEEKAASVAEPPPTAAPVPAPPGGQKPQPGASTGRPAPSGPPDGEPAH